MNSTSNVNTATTDTTMPTDQAMEHLLASDVDMNELMDDSDADSANITLNSIYPAGDYLAQIISSTPVVAKNAEGYVIPFNGKPRIGSHEVVVRLLFDIDRSKRVSGSVRGYTYEFSTKRMALLDNWEASRGRLLSSLAVAARYQEGLNDDGTLLTPTRIRELKLEAGSLIKQNAEGFRMKDIHGSAKDLLVRIRLKEEPARTDNGKTYEARNTFNPDYIDPPTNAQYNMVVSWNHE